MSYDHPTCPLCGTSAVSRPTEHLQGDQIVECGACGKNYVLRAWVAYDCWPLKTEPYAPVPKRAVGTEIRVRATPGWRRVKHGRREETVHLPPLDVRGTVEKVLGREVWVRFPVDGEVQSVVFRRSSGQEKQPKHDFARPETSGERRFWLAGEDVPAEAAFVIK